MPPDRAAPGSGGMLAAGKVMAAGVMMASGWRAASLLGRRGGMEVAELAAWADRRRAIRPVGGSGPYGGSGEAPVLAVVVSGVAAGVRSRSEWRRRVAWRGFMATSRGHAS